LVFANMVDWLTYLFIYSNGNKTPLYNPHICIIIHYDKHLRRIIPSILDHENIRAIITACHSIDKITLDPKNARSASWFES